MYDMFTSSNDSSRRDSSNRNLRDMPSSSRSNPRGLNVSTGSKTESSLNYGSTLYRDILSESSDEEANYEINEHDNDDL